MITKAIYKIRKDFAHTFLTFLNTGITDETLQQSGKQGSFKQELKRSTNKYETPGSHFFKIITGIKSGLESFEGISWLQPS